MNPTLTVFTQMMQGQRAMAVIRRSTIALAVLLGGGMVMCGFLASPAGASLVRGRGVPAAADTVLPSLGQTGKRPLSFYDTILSRASVFSAQRAAPAAADDSAAIVLDSGVAASLAELQLQGIVYGTRGYQAIIVNSRTEQSFDCRGGESLAGFLVENVLPDRVVLQRDGKTYELRL